MRIDALLPRQSDCIKCPDPIPCNCAAGQDCFRINRDCYTCSQTKCVAQQSSSSGKGSGGVSKGATAGAIIGVLLFLGIAVTLFLWYRRRMRLRRSLAVHEPPKDIPASAETVLNRPDPTEKPVPPQTELNTVRVYSASSNTTIDLDPESQHSSQHHSSLRRLTNSSNPFSDTTSIQTAGTEGTNVIPIALVPADSPRAFSPTSESHTQVSTTSIFPVRPARSPDLNLNLDHVNVSRENVRGPATYALSQISGISGVSSRNSYMSNASFSSDFLNEAPMIITPNKGAVRQVLGVVKAEVINAPGSFSAGSDSLKPPVASRPSVGSPLAAKSFGPADVVKEVDESQEMVDPFSDDASINADYGASPAATMSSFGPSTTGAVRDSQSDWVADTPSLPWAKSANDSRPSSMSTQAGSVADIGSATRVKVGLSGYTVASSQLSPNSIPRSPFRTTMGRLVSPSSAESGNLEEQQQRAIAHAQAQAHAQVQGGGLNRRVSTSSAVSATSTRADSILESFPFVPPSPISDRPIRSPPVSPLGQQSFSGATPPSPLSSQHIINIAPPSPLAKDAFGSGDSKDSADEALPPPPSRHTLGLSTASQFSTASSGLGSFPFQIDSGDGAAPPPSSFNGRQRASLDTLALTSDLSSYPLGFDRDSVVPPKN
ncbi:hypothetical protein Hypma_010225 [Hypsizygus marmoreus]|uniref:Membrane anchor Opy2 N-terminal domain-containing protein n=1 Tax=Hypsizygus marmoreus TaxID=39966 RepID=A0A369JKH9_HYPMA|nr:hypothetical protein Hypma_010225 [Hypsizygus marmoreus]